MLIPVVIIAVVLAVYLYDRAKRPPAVIPIPDSALTEDMSVEPTDEITLESIGAERDRGTMGAGVGHRPIRARVHMRDDTDTATERFGSDPAGRCTRGCAPHHSNPLINAGKSVVPEPCHYNGFYRYDEPCALYERR